MAHPNHIANPKFYLKNGDLTQYALGCGYLQTHYVGDVKVSLRKEHGTYNVTVGKPGEILEVDLWCGMIGDARREFRKAIKKLKQGAPASTTPA
jgi:hypothetical protein